MKDKELMKEVVTTSSGDAYVEDESNWEASLGELILYIQNYGLFLSTLENWESEFISQYRTNHEDIDPGVRLEHIQQAFTHGLIQLKGD